jgi:SOS-response transcriptional repressor LexA
MTSAQKKPYVRSPESVFHAGLTEMQVRIYEHIHERITTTGICPTYREMGRTFNLTSYAAVHGAVCRLVERGYLRKVGSGRARSLVLIDVEGAIPRGVKNALEALEAQARALVSKILELEESPEGILTEAVRLKNSIRTAITDLDL